MQLRPTAPVKRHLIPSRLMIDTCPFSASYGHDPLDVIGQEVPGIDARIDDRLIRVPDAMTNTSPLND